MSSTDTAQRRQRHPTTRRDHASRVAAKRVGASTDTVSPVNLLPVSSYSILSAPEALTLLLAMGSPEASLEDFTRIYHGPLARVLSFIAEHMRGRNAAAAVRATIQENRASSSAEQRRDYLPHTAFEGASSRLASSSKTSELDRLQLSDAGSPSAYHHISLKEAGADLDHAKKVSLLLQILEKKESIRMQRFLELTKLLVGLRCRVISIFKNRVKRSRPSADWTLPAQVSRVSSHVEKTLTTLQAYHIRLNKIIERTKTEKLDRATVEGRLRLEISKRLNVNTNDPSVSKVLNECRASARGRARNRICVKFAHSELSTSNRELMLLRDATHSKQRALQDLVDRSRGLLFLSHHFAKCLSNFLEQNTGILAHRLIEEEARAQGYVDVLRCAIIASQAPPKQQQSVFVDEVRRHCRLSSNTSNRSVLHAIEHAIREGHSLNAFFSGSTLEVPPHDPQCGPLTENAEALTKQDGEFITSLLHRKIDKAQMGQHLVQDINNILRDFRAVVDKEKRRNQEHGTNQHRHRHDRCA